MCMCCEVCCPLLSMVADAGQPVPARAPGAVSQMANPNYVGEPPYSGAWKDAAYDPEKPGALYAAGAWPEPSRWHCRWR